MEYFSEKNQRLAAGNLLDALSDKLQAPFSVELWDGTRHPMGKEVNPNHRVVIKTPGVLGSLLRKPTLDTLLGLYAHGYIDLQGDIIDFVLSARRSGASKRLKELKKSFLVKQLLPFLTARLPNREVGHAYQEETTGRVTEKRDNKAFIQFHYDVSNEFYKLFLDKEMQYSCGYFTKAENSLEQAQHDKLEMICRKLRLKPGEKMLDIGCGWGGLVCHAAQHHGVQAHGITLSQAQHDFAIEKIKRLGLQDKIKIELRDYATLEGKYDKISSIGMFEHIGIANMPHYFKKIHSLLQPQGVLLNHGISRRAKASKRDAKKIRPERRLLLKYIFPGSELDNLGNTVNTMEVAGFEVHDVEAWREHYGFTCKHWYRNLMANKEAAIKHVGEEKFRMWAIYLAGASIGFASGSIQIVQVLGSKKNKGPSGLPLTRADLYHF